MDLEAIRPQIDEIRAHTDLHACNGCEVSLARLVGADRVMVGHLNKMSTLILSLWIDAIDVKSGRRMLGKVQDFRGDSDVSWSRATDFFLDEFASIPADQR